MPSITEFLSGFKGGTRVNRFKVSSVGNVPIVGGDVHSIVIRATTFPDMTITAIPIQFRGKTIQLPSTRSFTPWTITVLDDHINAAQNQAGSLHHKFMQWSDTIVDLDEALGVSSFSAATNSATNPTWKIEQLEHMDGNGKAYQTGANPTIIKSFELANCWPIQVGPLQLSLIHI